MAGSSVEIVTICESCNVKLQHAPGKYVVCPECEKVLRFKSGILRNNLFELAKAIVGKEGANTLDDFVFGSTGIWHLDPDKVKDDLECCAIVYSGGKWWLNVSADTALTLEGLQRTGRCGNFVVRSAEQYTVTNHCGCK